METEITEGDGKRVYSTNAGGFVNIKDRTTGTPGYNLKCPRVRFGAEDTRANTLCALLRNSR